MQDFYLRFNDEVQATSVLYTTTLEVTDEHGVVVQEGSVKPNYANIDVIGTIYKATPVDAPEDYVPVALDGYHVNVRVIDEDATALISYSVVPTVPRRVWG